jgi:hypothetical protein
LPGSTEKIIEKAAEPSLNGPAAFVFFWALPQGGKGVSSPFEGL